LQLWNSRTRQKEEFVAAPLVRIYVCGITPYATTHLGHARTYLTFDLLIREIEHLGHIVRYAQNVTDVDDPLFERAQKMGITTAELARDCTRLFQDDLAVLRIRPPDFFPRASDEIPDIQKLIGELLNGGFAYQRDDRVYFRVQSFSRYGSFARLPRAEMLVSADEHGEDTSDPRKGDPLDFVLWKPSQPGETSWPSPWGVGRPGWHIECSAMALRYLGPDIDIHGGGSDLIYPHHENEIAQSEAGTGHIPMARYWVHAGMVKLEGTKMSKSLGNMVFVRDLRKRFSGIAIRHYLLTTHYRAELDYSEAGQLASADSTDRLETALTGAGADSDGANDATWENSFGAALADDLNTPLALEVLDRAVNRSLEPTASGKPSRAVLRRMAVRLGLAEEER
jgi:L-cysteine:1D-myo-inositol 2-amino-2-deoxy-alpha-D-glucopyranoside ligase